MGRTAAAAAAVAGTPAERSSGGSSVQTAEWPAEEAAWGRADEGRCVVGRAEGAALPATGDLGSRPADQEDLLEGPELAGLCTEPDSGGCIQPEGPEAVRYIQLGVGREQVREGHRLGLHARHHREAGPDVEGIRTAGSAGHSSGENGRSEVEGEEGGTGTAGCSPSSLDDAAPAWTRRLDEAGS